MLLISVLILSCNKPKDQINIANKLDTINKVKYEEVIGLRSAIQSEIKKMINAQNKEQLEQVDEKVRAITDLLAQSIKVLDNFEDYKSINDFKEIWQSAFNRLIIKDYSMEDDYNIYSPLVGRQFVKYDMMQLSYDALQDYAIDVDRFYQK